MAGRISRETVERLAAEVGAILTLPDIREKLAGVGSEALVMSPEQFQALVKAELEMYGRLIKAANIRLEP